MARVTTKPVMVTTKQSHGTNTKAMMRMIKVDQRRGLYATTMMTRPNQSHEEHKHWGMMMAMCERRQNDDNNCKQVALACHIWSWEQCDDNNHKLGEKHPQN